MVEIIRCNGCSHKNGIAQTWEKKKRKMHSIRTLEFGTAGMRGILGAWNKPNEHLYN